jgi:NADH-quinone oxidoreductase subunit H
VSFAVLLLAGASIVGQAAAPAATAVAPGATVSSATELAAQRGTNADQGGLWIEALLRQAVDPLPFVVPDWILVGGTLLLVCVLVFSFINVFALFAVWLERKVSAHIQCRLGPMEVGPHGILQTIADGIKLTAKEDIIPRLADKPLYILAPIIVFTGVLMRFVPLPFGQHLVASDLDLGLFFVAAVGSVEVIGVIMAGWSSNNKWSLFGTIRTATQMVSYEIPIGIAFVAVIVCAGSFSLQEIVNQQRGWFWQWYVLQNPFLTLLAIIYLVASLAECKRAPFDLPEAESELVSGFHTEYTGMRFGLFFLSEYAAMYLVSGVAVVLFLGGWWSGVPILDDIGIRPGSAPVEAVAGFLIKSVVFVSKAVILVFVQVWVRWTLPRVRLDQMMHLCWKVLLPISLVCLVGSTLWNMASGGGGLYGIPALFGY